ncbi:hypothetical protein VPH35_118514 [Triticum aestivum]
MAAFMLASADLVLLAPRLSNKAATDLECSLTVICNLVTKAGSEDEALEIARLICAKLTQQPGEKPMLRIKVLFSLYNLLSGLSGKALVYRKALELAAAGKAADCVVPTFKNIDAFVAYWGIGKPEQRDLMTKAYFKFLNKYLATFDGSSDEADAIGAAKEEAAAAIIVLLSSGSHLRLRSCVRVEKSRESHNAYDFDSLGDVSLSPSIKYHYIRYSSVKKYKIDHRSPNRHTARAFGMPQWQSLRSKLGVWRGNIANAINTIQASKVTEDGGQGMQGLMIR